jgi:hypothetical protein
MERKLAYSLPRSHGYPRQIVAEKNESLRVCPLYQLKENVVEYRDLHFVQAMCVSQKKRRHLP